MNAILSSLLLSSCSDVLMRVTSYDITMSNDVTECVNV